jgi:hypothetical protein
MASIETKSMDSPDETRTPDKTSVNVVHLGDATVARLTVQPGWRWSEFIEGDLRDRGVRHLFQRPGHDAWVLGDEPVVALEFESKTAATYAKA